MSEELAKLMWAAYAKQANNLTFDGKPLPTWEQLGEDRQKCWIAAAIEASKYLKIMDV